MIYYNYDTDTIDELSFTNAGLAFDDIKLSTLSDVGQEEIFNNYKTQLVYQCLKKDGLKELLGTTIDLAVIIPVFTSYQSINFRMCGVKKITATINSVYQIYDILLNDPRFMVFNNGVVVNICFTINNQNYERIYKQREFFDEETSITYNYLDSELWLFDSDINDEYHESASVDRPIFPSNNGYDSYLCETTYDDLGNREEIHVGSGVYIDTNTYEIKYYANTFLPQRGCNNICRQGFKSEDLWEYPPFCNPFDHHYSYPDCKVSCKIMFYYGCQIKIHRLVYKKVKGNFTSLDYMIHRTYHYPNYSTTKDQIQLFFPIIHKNGDTWNNSIQNLYELQYFPETRRYLWENGYFFWIDPNKIPQFILDETNHLFWNVDDVTMVAGIFTNFEPNISRPPKLYRWDSTSLPSCFA